MLQIGRIHSTTHLLPIFVSNLFKTCCRKSENEKSEEAEKGYRNYRECYNGHLQRILIKLTQEMLRHLSVYDGGDEKCECFCLWRHEDSSWIFINFNGSAQKNLRSTHSSGLLPVGKQKFTLKYFWKKWLSCP